MLPEIVEIGKGTGLELELELDGIGCTLLLPDCWLSFIGIPNSFLIPGYQPSSITTVLLQSLFKIKDPGMITKLTNASSNTKICVFVAIRKILRNIIIMPEKHSSAHEMIVI